MIDVYDFALIALIVALVELLKEVGLPKKWLPIVAILFGIAAGIFYVHPADLKGGIIVGLMLGLSASGLYSVSKHVVDKKIRK